MLPKNLESQTRNNHMETLHSLVKFYEGQIRKSLAEEDFRMARSWHENLSGAYMLASWLGLEEPDHHDREDMWDERIRTAQFGPRGKE